MMNTPVIDTNLVTVFWWRPENRHMSHWFINRGHIHLGRLEIFLRSWPIRLFFNRILWKFGKRPIFCQNCGRRLIEAERDFYQCFDCDQVMSEYGYFDADHFDEDEYHSTQCVCEECIQNYPERYYLLDDGEVAIRRDDLPRDELEDFMYDGSD